MEQSKHLLEHFDHMVLDAALWAWLYLSNLKTGIQNAASYHVKYSFAQKFNIQLILYYLKLNWE